MSPIYEAVHFIWPQKLSQSDIITRKLICGLWESYCMVSIGIFILQFYYYIVEPLFSDPVLVDSLV